MADKESVDRKEFEYKNYTGSRDIYPILKENSRENRNEPTDAEDFLWQHIRRKALGAKFRRQQPVCDFIADFMCIDKKLIIEVDGGYHDEKEQKIEDEQRSDRLYRNGYYVLRFRNEEVLQDIDFVLSRIKEILNKL